MDHDYSKKIKGEGDFWDKEVEVLQKKGFDFASRKNFRTQKPVSMWEDSFLEGLIRGPYKNEIIDRAVKSREPVVELGCGTGWLSREIASHGVDVEGYDVAHENIAFAQEQAKKQKKEKPKSGQMTFEIKDLNHAKFPAGKFGAVVVWDSLHHMAGLETICQTMKKALQKEGVFLIFDHIEFRGFRGMMSKMLALFFYIILPTEELFKEKCSYFWKKISGQKIGKTSPFEDVASADLEQTVEHHFNVEKKEYPLTFIRFFIARIRPQIPGYKSLVKALIWLDRFLGKIGILKGEYVFLVATPVKKSAQNIVLILGNYGAKNFGDELMLRGILHGLEKEGGCEKVVLSADPAETERLHGVKSFYVFPTGLRSFLRFKTMETIRQYRHADQVIFGGGTLFTDEVPRTIWISGMQILPAIVLKKKIVCLGQGVGPLHKNFSKWVVRQLFSRFEKIQVRDQESAEILKNIGVSKTIEVAPDPVFTIPLKPAHSSQKTSKKLLVSLREGPFLNSDFPEKLAAFLDRVHVQQKLQTEFLIFENSGNDRALSEKVAHLMTSHKPVITSVDFSNFETIFSSGAAALNFRLHANILSFRSKIPCIGFAYETKVKNLFKSVGKANFVIEPNDFEGLEKKWKSLNSA